MKRQVRAVGNHNGRPRVCGSGASAPQGWGWGLGRVGWKAKEKLAIAQYFARHDFLVEDGADAKDPPGETVASVLVTPGTTQATVVDAALTEIDIQWSATMRFVVTWYTPASRVAGILMRFRDANFNKRSAADAFLFPGPVDPDVESVIGPYPVDYINGPALQGVGLKYSFLSAYNFDMATGRSLFFYPNEIPLQRACARLYAKHKCVFLHTGKLGHIGHEAYNIEDLLETSEMVTIYTNSIGKRGDAEISAQFQSLVKRVLDPIGRGRTQDNAKGCSSIRSLRLCLVPGRKEDHGDGPCGDLEIQPFRGRLRSMKHGQVGVDKPGTNTAKDEETLI